MAQPPISLIPESLDLKLYGGDGVELRLVVSDPLGVPIPLTGEIAAQIRSNRGNEQITADFDAEFTDPDNGVCILSLTGAQTASLHGTGPYIERFQGVWDCQWTPDGSEPVTLIQGNVESNLDVTRI